METYLVDFNPEEKRGIFGFALVKEPAIEEVGIYLSKEEEIVMLKEIEKGLLMTPVLIPNQKILRVTKNGEPYNIMFPKETIELAQRHFHINGHQSNSNSEHTDLKLNGVTIVESWIKEFEQDKSNEYGFDLPIGTWFAIMKVENEEVREKIKSGEIKGISIEGEFKLNNYKMSKENTFLSALKDLLSIKDDVQVELSTEETPTDTPKEEDVKLAIDAPDGKYVGEDGTTLVVVAGEVTEVMKTESEVEVEVEEESVDMQTQLSAFKNETLVAIGKMIEANNVNLKAEFLKATEISLSAQTTSRPETREVKEPKNFKEAILNELNK
jgi:hypothetical protein